MLSEQQNPQGLHARYLVSKTSGEPVDENAVYFVLRLDSNGDDQQHIAACRAAARAYADHVQSGEAPHLAQVGVELRRLVEQLSIQ